MLTLDHISAGYDGFQALSDISLTVNAGETVGVIGPNGAGKTTLLRVISRLIAPTSGSMSFEGKSLNDVPAHELVGMGIAHVPEHRRLFPRLSVEDNLRMGAYTPLARAHFGERLARVYEMFPRMQERRLQAAGTLSGGEQQMCAIARALMCGPRLLLLDEPSAGLAPIVVQSIFEAINAMRKQGYTVLIVEQNIRQVLKLADRAYLLEAGHIKASGTAQNIVSAEKIKQTYLGL